MEWAEKGNTREKAVALYCSDSLWSIYVAMQTFMACYEYTIYDPFSPTKPVAGGNDDIMKGSIHRHKNVSFGFMMVPLG